MSQLASQNAPSSKSSRELSIESELVQIIQSSTILRGTLNERQNTCGKSTCRCLDGDGHPALYLVLRKADGSLNQIYVGKRRQREIVEAVENFQRVQTLLDELSTLRWKRLKRR